MSAGLLTGEAAVLALHRLAQCPREQHSQLRVSAPFTQLLALLEKQAFTLNPKVCTSFLCTCLLCLSVSCFRLVHSGGVCRGTCFVRHNLCQFMYVRWILIPTIISSRKCQLIVLEHTSFLRKA